MFAKRIRRNAIHLGDIATMKEARIIFPVSRSLAPFQAAIHLLVRNFGGATITPGEGHWTNPNGQVEDEPIRVVDVAYEQNTGNDMLLFQIAKSFLKEAGEIEIYLRYGNGTVQLIRERDGMDNGRPNEAYHPDFAGIVDAVNQLIDGEQTPGTRVAAFEFIHHALDLGTKGNHKAKAA